MRNEDLNMSEVARILSQKSPELGILVDPPKYGAFGSDQRIYICSITLRPDMLRSIASYKFGNRWYTRALVIEKEFQTPTSLTISYRSASTRKLAEEIGEIVKSDTDLDVRLVPSFMARLIEWLSSAQFYCPRQNQLHDV